MAIPLDSSSLVTVYGGSGFLGQHVVRALAKTGARIRVAVRRPELAIHLQPSGGVGQINAVQANLRDEASVLRAAEGADGVVNLVGILFESGKQTYRAVQVEGAARVAKAAARADAGALVHVSAIGADPSSPAAYGRAKAEAEDAARAGFPDAVILRPSVVFGPDDDFFNRFAAMARMSPFLPLVGGGRTRFQPVYADDVADAVLAGLSGRARPGAVYELGGPEILDMRQIMERVLRYTMRSRALLPIPFWAASIQGAFLQLLPGAPILTRDQVRMLTRDAVVSAGAEAEGRTFAGLGIAPTAIEGVVPAYLERFRPRGEFSK
jgi:uncharacterized protein YbjT (DUF2867 family)